MHLLFFVANTAEYAMEMSCNKNNNEKVLLKTSPESSGPSCTKARKFYPLHTAVNHWIPGVVNR